MLKRIRGPTSSTLKNLKHGHFNTTLSDAGSLIAHYVTDGDGS